jgi:hypothetical protein
MTVALRWRRCGRVNGVVAGGDLGEVLRLRGRYTVIRHESIKEETRTGWGSHKTGKSGHFFGRIPVRRRFTGALGR